MKLIPLFLALSLTGCVFDGEPEKNCNYEATIGCGPGCTPRIVHEAIVCPNSPFTPDGGDSTP